jgi:hypothetical protein
MRGGDGGMFAPEDSLRGGCSWVGGRTLPLLPVRVGVVSVGFAVYVVSRGLGFLVS